MPRLAWAPVSQTAHFITLSELNEIMYAQAPCKTFRQADDDSQWGNTQEALGSLQDLKINTEQIRSQTKSCHTIFRMCSFNGQFNSVTVLEGKVPQVNVHYCSGRTQNRIISPRH